MVALQVNKVGLLIVVERDLPSLDRLLLVGSAHPEAWLLLVVVLDLVFLIPPVWV